MVRALSFPVVLGAMLIAGAFAGTRWRGIPAGKLFTQGDTWWHIAVGEHIASTARWPTSDTYSCTAAGSDWIASEWLGEILMGLAWRAAGLRGVAALLVALSAIVMLLLYHYTCIRSRNPKAAAVACALLLPVTAAFFSLRPQLIGLILLLITLICLELFRQNREGALWVLPPVFLLWINTHGTFLLGLVVLLAHLAGGLTAFQKGGLVAERWTGGQRRRLLAVLLICVAVLPLTPYGTHPAAIPVKVALSQPLTLSSITEWQPIDFTLPYAQVFLGLLLLFIVTSLIPPRPRHRVEDVGLLLFAIYIACLHRRLIFFFAAVFAPMLVAQFARWCPTYQPEKDRPVLNAVLLVLIAVGIVGFFPSQQRLEQTLRDTYPQDATAFLDRHSVSGCVLNEVTWGGYLLWKRGGQVFIDGRNDFYESAGVLADYIRIRQLDPSTPFLLRKYSVDACVLEKGAALAAFLEPLPDWERVYSDRLSLVLARRNARQQPGAGPAGSCEPGGERMLRSP